MINNPFRIRFLVIGTFLFLSSSLGATSEDSATQTNSEATEDSTEECYCSIRKRKQVEKRIEKKKQLEPE